MGLAGLAGISNAAAPAASDDTNSAAAWLREPLSLLEAINVALEQNGRVRQAKADVEATQGVIVQTRAIALPKVRALGDYEATDATESLPLPSSMGFPEINLQNDQRWSAGVRVVQSIYEGGRITSALRTTDMTRKRAMHLYQTVVADTILGVKTTYYDALLAAQLIQVQEASLNLLQRELQDVTRRYEAGTVPRFNVLRAEVELANAQPRLIRARNAYRIAKSSLATQLGYQVPQDVWEDVPLQLSDNLSTEPLTVDLPLALGKALAQRSELAALREAERLGKEQVIQARAGYKPSVQLFGGYGWRSSVFSEDLTRDISGWNAGAQLNWEIFDAGLTRGRVQEAKALRERAQVSREDAERQVELEVRTAYSQFLEAGELLASQAKVQEQAVEALRLANSRAEAGTGTQLDVLSAQTALTEARTTQIQAQRDYLVARSRLERAIGESVPVKAPK
jgi:outer membrane protein TolC